MTGDAEVGGQGAWLWSPILTHRIKTGPVLTGVAQLVGHGWLQQQKREVTGLIPGQGTCQGCRLGPQSGHI